MADLFDAGERHKTPEKTCTPAPLGTGPEGETCGTCRYLVRNEYRSGHFLKCELMRKVWTHGPGSDIRAKWRACREWEKIETEKPCG